MSAERNCREQSTTGSTNTKSLEEFVVVPGETLEESLSRAMAWHNNKHTFAEISRTVSMRRLESSIAEIKLTDKQRRRMQELFQYASSPVRGVAARMMSMVLRANLRGKLAQELSRSEMFAIQAYEYMLVPPAEEAAEEMVSIPSAMMMTLH